MFINLRTAGTGTRYGLKNDRVAQQNRSPRFQVFNEVFHLYDTATYVTNNFQLTDTGNGRFFLPTIRRTVRTEMTYGRYR
jgi:hypothetical protein